MSSHKDKLYNNAIINSFKIKSDSIEVLKEAIKIAFSTHNTAMGFSSTVNVLTMYWRDCPNCTNYIKFKKPLNVENSFDFIYEWLMNVDSKDRLVEEVENQNGGDFGFGFKICSKGNNDYEIFHISSMNLYYKP